MDILRIARILDVNGRFLLADKLDKFAQMASKKRVYDELRKDRPDKRLIIGEYAQLLMDRFKLSEEEMDSALWFAEELADNSKSIRILNDIFFYMRRYNFDRKALRSIAENFEDALCDYVMKNLKSIKIKGLVYSKESFLDKSNEDKKRFILDNLQWINLKNGLKASDVRNPFLYTNIYLNKLYDGDIDKALDLVEFFNKSAPYILPLVYDKVKTHSSEKYYREQDIQTEKLLGILKGYIGDDSDMKKSIVSSLSSLDNFVNLISISYPDLLDKINGAEISLNEFRNRINFLYLKKELSK
jgi:hypothetical protein